MRRLLCLVGVVSAAAGAAATLMLDRHIRWRHLEHFESMMDSSRSRTREERVHLRKLHYRATESAASVLKYAYLGTPLPTRNSFINPHALDD
jgi:hypothetical protein